MTAHIIISGFVQGVGFRQFVKKEAGKLSLKGWVKNIDRGRVEALFDGEKELIEKMINLCKKGPFLAEVKNIEVEWEDKNMDFNSFELIV
jgi:acylphosphatase